MMIIQQDKTKSKGLKMTIAIAELGIGIEYLRKEINQTLALARATITLLLMWAYTTFVL